ncbi:MAG TPA: GNAT family N-acetyltransferase [Thiotrichales bacterium]|nr:GNAT family N-acetyltransferase [Thiotrichales bacterium]
MAIRVESGPWTRLAEPARAIRYRVFVEEQSVPVALEWDDLDATALHLLAWEGDEAVGTARLLPSGQVGRMAVLPPWRGRGVGRALMETVIDRATERGMERLFLHAQVHAIPFYARFGFEAVGPEFVEADIPHREMVLDL